MQRHLVGLVEQRLADRGDDERTRHSPVRDERGDEERQRRGTAGDERIGRHERRAGAPESMQRPTTPSPIETTDTPSAPSTAVGSTVVSVRCTNATTSPPMTRLVSATSVSESEALSTSDDNRRPNEIRCCSRTLRSCSASTRSSDACQLVGDRALIARDPPDGEQGARGGEEHEREREADERRVAAVYGGSSSSESAAACASRTRPMPAAHCRAPTSRPRHQGSGSMNARSPSGDAVLTSSGSGASTACTASAMRVPTLRWTRGARSRGRPSSRAWRRSHRRGVALQRIDRRPVIPQAAGHVRERAEREQIGDLGRDPRVGIVHQVAAQRHACASAASSCSRATERATNALVSTPRAAAAAVGRQEGVDSHHPDDRQRERPGEASTCEAAAVDLRQLEAFGRRPPPPLRARGQELYLSQPAVSQAVHRLERELGGELFDRTSRRVELSARRVRHSSPLCGGRGSGRRRRVRARSAHGRPRRSPADRGLRRRGGHRPRRRHPRGAEALPGPADRAAGDDHGRPDALARGPRARRGVVLDPQLDDRFDHLDVGASRLVAMVRDDHPLASASEATMADVVDEPLIAWGRAVNPALYDRFAGADGCDRTAVGPRRHGHRRGRGRGAGRLGIRRRRAVRGGRPAPRRWQACGACRSWTVRDPSGARLAPG